MAEMALEYIFKIFIYMVAVLVIIGIILNFQTIAQMLKLPCFFPGCEGPKECETFRVDESVIDANVLKKYCDLCWERTGKLNYPQDCLCYVIKGSFSPISFSHPNCELKCSSPATAVFIEYRIVDGNITIEC